MMGWHIRCKTWLGRWLQVRISAAPRTSSSDMAMTREEEEALRREIMANEWRGLGGEEIGRRLYGESRTFITDHIHRQGGSNVAQQAKVLGISRGSVYYRPRPV